MPRKSAASNVVSLTATTHRPVLSPIGPPLTKAEREFFDHFVKTSNHLKPVDVPNVMLLACAMVRAMAARNDDDGFDRETRTVLSLARSLRLTVHSTIQAITAGRHREEPGLSYYDRMAIEEQH